MSLPAVVTTAPPGNLPDYEIIELVLVYHYYDPFMPKKPERKPLKSFPAGTRGMRFNRMSQDQFILFVPELENPTEQEKNQRERYADKHINLFTGWYRIVPPEEWTEREQWAARLGYHTGYKHYHWHQRHLHHDNPSWDMLPPPKAPPTFWQNLRQAIFGNPGSGIWFWQVFGKEDPSGVRKET